MNLRITRNPPTKSRDAELATPLLVIGAAHTGKSVLAMDQLDRNQPAAIIGTGDVDEVAFGSRLAELRSLRPPHWHVTESMVDIPKYAEELMGKYPQVLVDSLNQWVAATYVLLSPKYSIDQIEAQLELEFKRLLELVKKPGKCRLVFVTSEVGAGTTPPQPLERAFRLTMGRFNTRIAAACSSVVLISAGIPLVLKKGHT